MGRCLELNDYRISYNDRQKEITAAVKTKAKELLALMKKPHLESEA